MLGRIVTLICAACGKGTQSLRLLEFFFDEEGFILHHFTTKRIILSVVV